MMATWPPSFPEVRWPPDKHGNYGSLTGDGDWPETIELVAWERSDEGERRIKAVRRYRLEPGQ